MKSGNEPGWSWTPIVIVTIVIILPSVYAFTHVPRIAAWIWGVTLATIAFAVVVGRLPRPVREVVCAILGTVGTIIMVGAFLHALVTP